MKLLKKNWAIGVVTILVVLYVSYFSVFTVLRIKQLGAHYFDLGIMHQAVYNTYQAIRTFDCGRILEIANPHGTGFVKRMAVHNDILLAFIAPLYFIYSGPQTLVVLQTIILGLGAFAVFGIVGEVFKKSKYKGMIGVVFAFAYLMYVPMQRANIFDFHAVTLATSFLLYVYYFWLKKRYGAAFLFFILSLLTKEQIGATTFLLSCFMLFPERNNLFPLFKKKETRLPFIIMILSVVWTAASMILIIPYFRGGGHFALGRYSVAQNPLSVFRYIFHKDTYQYLWYLLGPLAFLSILTPFIFLISGVEFAINLLSDSWNMRMIIYHYTSVIQPFIFISAIYGAHRIIRFVNMQKKEKTVVVLLTMCIIFSTLYFSYTKGPLFFSREADMYPFTHPAKNAGVVADWSHDLKDESISVSANGHLAPFFTSRRKFYYFPNGYENADYVVVQLSEVYNYFDREVDVLGMYQKLQKDPRFILISRNQGIEVYQKKQ